MTTELTIHLDPELAQRLEGLARDMGRDPAEVAAIAIDAYIEANAWQVRHIREGLDEDNSGAPGIPHEQVVDWVRSWGTEQELLRPTPPKGDMVY